MQVQDSMETNNESILKCEICLENLSDSSFSFKDNHQCEHAFCKVCIKQYITVEVSYITSKFIDQAVCNVACPGPKCRVTLDPLSCREYLPSHIFTKWCDNLCQQVILGFSRAYCPNRKCSMMVISECAGDVRKVTCPNCKKTFCFMCEVPWHGDGYTCEESREMMNNQNDKKFKKLAKKSKWRSCPRCKHCIERIEGCDHMYCRCKTEFCYKCGRSHSDESLCMGIWCRIHKWVCNCC